MNTIKPYLKFKMLAVLMWSFACGLPLLLTTTTLATRLAQNNISMEIIGLFGLATLAYAGKYFLTPLMELISIPFLQSRLGRARSWMLLMIPLIMLGFEVIGYLAPTAENIPILFAIVVIVVLFSSIMDIAEAEYRIELMEADEFAYGVACYTAGYRLGMITGGGIALLLAYYDGWQFSYHCMALCMLIAIPAILLQKHKYYPQAAIKKSLLSIYLDPVMDIMKRPYALSLLALVATYNYAESLLLLIVNPFLLQAGFTLAEIGIWQGSFGGVFALMGSLFAGIINTRINFIRTLDICAILYASINLVFIPLTMLGNHSFAHYLFYLQSIISNLILGVSTAAFGMLIASQSQRPYTASQNAFLTSVMAAAKMLLMSVSGLLIYQLHYLSFFIFIFMLLPCLLLLLKRYQRVIGNSLS